MDWWQKFLIGVALVLMAGWLFVVSRTWGFKGDGKLSYLGPFRPSYNLKMATIPLDKAGEYRYRFQGLPALDDVNLLLEVVGKSEKDRQELENVKTLMEASLVDAQGKTICVASGKPGPPADEHNWILESGGMEDDNWYHIGCLHFATDSHQSYRLTLRIREPDPQSPKAILIPTLQGGGIELP